MLTRNSLTLAGTLAIVLCLAAGGAGAGMTSPTSDVPVPGGMYQGTNEVGYYMSGSGSILVQNIKIVPSLILPTIPLTPLPPSGGTVTANSFFDVFGEVSYDGGTTYNTMFAAHNPTAVKITSTGSDAGIRTFDTEMLQLDIHGGTLPPNVMIRESPTKASTGKHDVTTQPTDYMIDSFFDVFTELSVDSGNTWLPAVGIQGPDAVHLVLTPEPATMTLLGLGSLVALIRRKRSA